MKLSTPITNLHEKGHGTKKHADIGLGRVTRAQTFTEGKNFQKKFIH